MESSTKPTDREATTSSQFDTDQAAQAIALLWSGARDMMLTAPTITGRKWYSGQCNAYVNAIGRCMNGVSGTYGDGEAWLKTRNYAEPYQ